MGCHHLKYILVVYIQWHPPRLSVSMFVSQSQETLLIMHHGDVCEDGVSTCCKGCVAVWSLLADYNQMTCDILIYNSGPVLHGHFFSAFFNHYLSHACVEEKQK